MTSGTEQQVPILPERRVVRISGYGIGRWLLLAHCHKKFLARACLSLRYHLVKLSLEEITMAGRHSEMQVDLTL